MKSLKIRRRLVFCLCQELEKNAATAREEAQHEIASLQDVHRSKLASLKKTHKEEINQLKSKVSDLEQQLADGEDGGLITTFINKPVSPYSSLLEVHYRHEK